MEFGIIRPAMKIIHTSDWHLGARLHEEDRSAGVISHVKAVEERLPLRIRVEAAGAGHGRLRGEGAIADAVREKDK